MRFLSVCSGIEAASVAWAPLGWKAVAFSEIEPFPCAVLAHHYPDTPNWGDMTKFMEWPDVAIDLLCGGTPCQSFSVAGLRKGLDDPRGNLMLTFGAIAAKYRPQWLVWENVPGVLSSNGGRDFGAFLGMLGQLGYGFAYRVLDAQYFGVAQRRRRVFVVGCLGDWRRAAAVLFERHSLSGDSAPSRKQGQDAAGCLASRTDGGGFPGTDEACSGYVQPVAGTLTASFGRLLGQSGQDADHGHSHLVPDTAHTLRGEGFDASEDGTGRGTPLVPVAFQPGNLSRGCGSGPSTEVFPTLKADHGRGQSDQDPHVMVPVPFDTTQITSATNRSNPQHGDPCHPLAAGAHPPAIAFHPTQDPISNTDGTTHAMGCGSSGGTASIAVAVALRGREGGATAELGDDVQNCLRASSGGGDKPHVLTAMQVRRLTPTECERLQGFPDGYTAIPWRKKPASECPDGPRYKALGNSWATPNVQWIGRRINSVDQITKETAYGCRETA